MHVLVFFKRLSFTLCKISVPLYALHPLSRLAFNGRGKIFTTFTGGLDSQAWASLAFQAQGLVTHLQPVEASIPRKIERRRVWGAGDDLPGRILTWGIIPFSKWLITMVSKSLRVVPFPNGLNAYKWGVINHLPTGMILQVLSCIWNIRCQKLWLHARDWKLSMRCDTSEHSHLWTI